MSQPPTDPVALLLPETTDASRERARRVTTFLRLLSADARPRRAEVVGLDVGRVRQELERLGRERRLAWTLVLLRHHVRALLPCDSFLAAPPACADRSRALREWTRELELAGEELPWRDPHASPRTRAEGLLGVLRALAGADGDETRLFEAYLAHVTRGPAAGERRWRALTARGREPVASLAAAGVAAALLERGRVRAARRWIQDPRRRDTELLRRLGRWARLLETGVPEDAAAPAPVPLPLHELRERLPRLAAALEGTALEAGPPRPLPFEGLLAQSGAVAFVVFALADDLAVPVHWELAPPVRATFDGFCVSRRSAHRTPGQPEHELVRTARGLVGDRLACGSDDASLSPRTRAVAREPFFDREGAVRGWLHLEFEHHLVPATEVRRALAAECATRVRLFAEPACGRAAGDARAEAARALVASLGKPAARRRWWVFDREGDQPVLSGGGALGRDALGGGGIVRRVRVEGVACSFDGPLPELSCHADAASGAAVPLVFAGRVHGVLALESARRGDVDESLCSHLAQAALRHASSWRAAQFARWHAQRFTRPVVLRLDGGGWRSVLPVLVVAARRREPVGLYGPPGVGRIVVARWLHFEGPAPSAPLDSLRGTSEEETLARIAAARPGGTLVLGSDVLTRGVRAALAVRRRRERGAPPDQQTLLVLLARRSGELEDGPPHLVRRTLGVPPLARRRDELPALFALLLGAPLPRESLALLWRQPWTGNLPELAAFLAAARERADGRELTAALLRDVARRAGVALVERLPRRPADGSGPAAAVEAALALSRRPGGRPNKQRAAELLGWDPATLAQHARREDDRQDGRARG